MLDLRSPDSTGHLFLLFLFQFSFFFSTKLGLFLLLPFAFIFFPLITHVCFSLLENDLRRTVEANPRLRSHRLADEIVCRHRQTPPTCPELRGIGHVHEFLTSLLHSRYQDSVPIATCLCCPCPRDQTRTNAVKETCSFMIFFKVFLVISL